MAVEKPTTTKKPEEVKQKIDWPKAFKSWAEGRTGLTEKELIDVFASLFNLTPEERKTLEGKVKVIPPKPPTPKPPTPPPTPPPKQPTIKPELIIARTPYPKWWKDSRAWNINIDLAGTWTVINKQPGYYNYVSCIFLTVDGEVNITFGMGVFGSSGPIDLGGTNEPRGIVIAMGNSPLPCGEGAFTITSNADGVHIGGFIVHYYERISET